ncbi:putative flavin-containing monooxygenase 1 [Rosa sericea]
MEKRVAVVGAGISGLLACKYTLSKGFRPIVFESTSTIGGVWTKTVETTKLQTPKAFYQFSDFPWPSSVTEDHPNQNQSMKAYLRMRWNLGVCGGGTGEPFSSEGKWKVIVEDKQSLSTETYLVDFVILCIGRFSDVPNIPEFTPNKGPKAFHGTVIHSMEYADMDYESAAKFVTGKQVTVVGSQKFAMDIAMECSNANGIENPCTLLYRTEHWNFPDLLPWGVPLAFLYFNCFSELLVHKPGEGFLLSLLATLLSPLRWAYSKFVETYANKKLGLYKYGMVPKQRFLQDISSCLIAVVPENFYDRVQEGSIILKKSLGNFGFCQEGILVEGEVSPLTTELVILATGFNGEKKLKNVFVSPTFQDYIMGSQEAILPLYRQSSFATVHMVLSNIHFIQALHKWTNSTTSCDWIFREYLKLVHLRDKMQMASRASRRHI